MADYANPDVLVSTDWVVEHGNDPNVRLVEVDVDTSSYDKGHIEGAVGLNWNTQLCDQIRRELLDENDWVSLLSGIGITNNTIVIAYGDNNNWFAAWFVWQLKYYGHQDARLMNGDRLKWEKENRPLITAVPSLPAGSYTAPTPDASLRASRANVEKALGSNINLADVRSPDEFSGKVLAPEGLNETCQRGGHIPVASSIPWAKAVNEDGTLKSREELDALYQAEGVTLEKPTIAYCRIGERSSHSWFVLKYLMGYTDVRNYDGSWTEWGNLVGAPIEKGPGS